MVFPVIYQPEKHFSLEILHRAEKWKRAGEEEKKRDNHLYARNIRKRTV